MLDSHTPIFEGALSQLDTNQKTLLYWCKFYYANVFSLSENERPHEFVIDYDILLDDYLERKRFAEENKSESRQRASATDMDNVITFG